MQKILIIEDEIAIRNVLKNILLDENKKFQIDEASNGEEGFKKITEKNYNLIICDIKMPKMDGIEVLEKSIHLGIDTPFVMISGHGDIETAIECIKKGSFDYNYYGKVIIDVSRINQKEITRYMHSIHRPLEYTCLVPLKEYDVGILRVHHYLGSWKEYSSRSDIRRNKEKFFRKSTVDGGTDYQLQQWLKKFILKVGVSKSKMLLESAGIIDYGKVPIIHPERYTFLNDSYFDHDA